MERTQRLLAIATAVLALDGCRGGSQQALHPTPESTSSPASHSGGAHVAGGHMSAAGAVLGGAAAGAAGRTRTLGGNRDSATRADGEGGGRYGSHGGFGEAGAHGGGG